MKRDMDLVRKIAFFLEDQPHGHASKVVVEGYSEEEIGYHAYLMLEAGLVRGCNTSHMRSPSPCAIATGLTWQGHEFVDLARSESVWGKAKKHIKEKVGSATVGILLDVLKQQAKEALGLA
jgi:hypothetical protein